jgi:NDP-4-keto-2,6-dideoxyhexose 3-C-methyltransferase
MFYDLPDPNAFVANISSVLAPDGLWVLEQSYLPAMLDRNSFDTICHEHLEYYCFEQIERVLKTHGLRAFDVSLNDVNGGSFQVWACHADAHYEENAAAISALRQRERDEGFSSAALLMQLPGRVESIRNEVLSFLRHAREQGKLVHGYGASTKGNTTLRHFGIDSDLLPAIADRNEEKYGCRTPGTNIPIISEQESRAANPDYYFVLPWHFRQGFIQREKQFLERGGQLVFPLPKLEIVSR